MTRLDSPTAKLFQAAIFYSDKTQDRIAKEAGFSSSNIISMMKTGETKVPIERIPSLAKACSIDPILFVRSAMIEYHPLVWETIERSLGHSLSEDEVKIITAYRRGTMGEEMEVPPCVEDWLVFSFICCYAPEVKLSKDVAAQPERPKFQTLPRLRPTIRILQN